MNQLGLVEPVDGRSDFVAVADMLGAVLSVLAGFASCRISGAIGLKNPLFLGILLVLYGVLGIYLHPDHPMLMQVGTNTDG